jgi:uncharacterized protein YndB with AHSA1/START domain
MAMPSPGLTLEMTRALSVGPSVVFGFFTDATRLARWWGPKGFTIPSLAFEPRVGASYRIEMQPPEGDAFHLAGEFRAVDPPTRHELHRAGWTDSFDKLEGLLPGSRQSD